MQGGRAWCRPGVYGGVCGELYYNTGVELCVWRDFQGDLQYTVDDAEPDLRLRVYFSKSEM